MTVRKTTLITDFDNTLYDWFHMWHQSFSAMLAEIERISGIERATLIPEIRALHQRYGTSEYAFLIENIPSLQQKFQGKALNEVFDEAVHAYRSARKESLRLYDGVQETLTELASLGVMVVVYTESLAFYTNDRIRRLGLDSVVDFIYSPPDHEVPNSVTNHAEREKYRLIHAKHRYLKAGEIKPNPAVLGDIVAGIGRSREECIYLGDSLMKDIAMAQDAKITDVFASYGVSQNREGYKLLQQVSHWPEADVQREMVTRHVAPTHTITRFSEIKRFFEV
jgi:phosphoglycolate phosphatase-like HAD superfamily hydrolase